MPVVFAIDALEYEKVEEFDCDNLKQVTYGKTDISEFDQPRTMVLWSSFMTGENKEEEILAKGDKEMWNTKFSLEETFFSNFENPEIIDLPGYSYDREQHERERELLKEFFEEAENEEDKKEIRKEYNQHGLEHHRKIKEKFLQTLKKDHDFVLGYFSAADVIGHLNFGNRTLMEMIYDDLDEIAEKIGEIRDDHLLILSDHGMEGVGMFGDHNGYGYWSFDDECELERPELTDFADFLVNL
ncbi:hypothetical protein AKJ37_03095 [candidate division MSBL1 archaeon SCGC-AAA259I09]|uniref:Metalloenzyme domain-containing protein n=3 Tax=candidate division MSBL1 TaxID=215777 RepID=A0A133USZ9_9EURY|nr:hypothetical protein AKJ38_01675 [candidate division MSBL1 archaeon SCGC-AAA259I14]KXA97379.1 hypothetical protein AKJ37_03095 [candidate division MSBL1 archaeon SCGC-AAA259I09]KXA99577.1 hypothetical protein AKJ40_02795 [candidate division MSBL1 archaeon SCGC-AAA259M10]